MMTTTEFLKDICVESWNQGVPYSHMYLDKSSIVYISYRESAKKLYEIFNSNVFRWIA